MKFKKYIVFVCVAYYPSGGLSDIKDSFDNIDKAKEFADKECKQLDGYGWVSVVDRDTWEEVYAL